MADLDYLTPNRANVVGSIEGPDGTVFEARAGALGNGLVKVTTNEDGSKTEEVLTFTKTSGARYRGTGASKRTNDNTRAVLKEFDAFAAAAKAAMNTTETISYTDADVTSGGGGFLRSDKPSTVTLTDAAGNKIGSVGTSKGKTATEIETAKKL